MENDNIKYFQKPETFNEFSSYVLGIDIGGTNTNIAIAGVMNHRPILLLSSNYCSKTISSIESVINETIYYAKKNYHIDIFYGCIGAAGVVSKTQDKATLTNVPLHVDCHAISKKTGLSNLFVINDFQLIGYGINLLDLKNEEDIIKIKGLDNKNEMKDTKIIIGAGTGLGKCVLIYDMNQNLYVPYPSEGGHSDFPIYNQKEYELILFIKGKYGQDEPVTYEQVLSGQGLLNIYEFLDNDSSIKKREYTIKTPDDISLYRKQDMLCQKTFDFFVTFYARCIKNLILDTMSLGGVYIAGGIAMKNFDLFQSQQFLKEIENVIQRKKILHNVPLYIIKNYDVSIMGACLAAIYNYKL